MVMTITKFYNTEKQSTLVFLETIIWFDDLFMLW